MSWKQFMRNYFLFTKGERNGLLVLMGVLLLIIYSSKIVDLFRKAETTSNAEFLTQADSLQAQMDKAASQDSTEHSFKDEGRSGSGLTVLAQQEPFVFDPNTATAEDWRKLGLSDKVIKTISNYKAKGGKFYKKEDLKKIYDRLISQIQEFGEDIEISPKNAYVSLRRKKQFATLQPATKTRFEIGINLKGVEPKGILQSINF